MVRQLCLLAISTHFLFAQETVHHASVSGRVVDPSGGVVSGAKVTARNVDTNLTNRGESDREGRFRLPYLKIGTYQITVTQPGFGDSVRSLALSAGGAYELAIILKVGIAETQVTVESDSTLLEAARSQVVGTVAEAEVRALPLNGRNFLDLALLIPGVSPTNTGSNQLFAETSAVPGQGISVGSQRNFSNSFVVDGLSANDDAAGLSGIFYGLDTVQEFQVVTSGAQAELGRALGGFINVVTKSGTNRLRGDLYGYFRNQRLNAANPLSNSKLPSTQAQYGASVGGPVIRDRTFFFSNFEQRQLNQSGLITITPSNLAAINTRLDAVGFGGLRPTTGIYPNPVHLTNILAKVDHQFSARDQFSVRYSLYSLEHLARLWPLRRRPAASRNMQRCAQLADGPGSLRLAAPEPWFTIERLSAVLLRFPAEPHHRCHHRARFDRGAFPGLDYDNIGELIERIEGPNYR